MNETDRLFIEIVKSLRLLDERYRIMALFAAAHWDDERLSRGIGGESYNPIPEGMRTSPPDLRLVQRLLGAD